MSYSVGMISLGCDKNRVDAEIMLSRLSKSGYKIVSDEKEADIILVNTCGFIESAKLESIETIIEMAQNKETGRCKCVIATGCMSERYRDELLKEIPELDAIVGTGSYRDICEIVASVLQGNKGIVSVKDINFSLDYEERILTTPKHYAYVKIAEGCNNNCSYCIIPKLRGKFRSRNIESIVGEVKKLAKDGVKEIIIVAQDTTMYGIDIYGKKMIVELLEEIEKVEDIEWIRVMYSYPEDLTDELVYYIKESKKVCNYFDIPLQHVSNKILKLMRRRSRKENIEELIQKIRMEIPDSIIRTSIIVGFPGEGEEEFDELKSFLEEYKLDRVGIFTYSAEENTSAAEMEYQISEEIKEQRKDILMKLQSKISFQKNKDLTGRVIDVIIDGKNKEGQYFGRTFGDAPEIDQEVYINHKDREFDRGDVVRVKVTKAFTYDLIGDVEDEFSK